MEGATVILSKIVDGVCIVTVKFDNSIEQTNASINFKWKLGPTWYMAKSELIATDNPPLLYYTEGHYRLSIAIRWISQALQYLYLAFYLVCLSCGKMIGAETM